MAKKNQDTLDPGSQEVTAFTRARPRRRVAPDAPRLVLLTGGEPKSYDVGAELTIGRAAECTIQLQHHGVSRRHALIRETSRGYVLEDLGSRNGTFVNGHKVKERLLEFGDEIQLSAGVSLLYSRARFIDAQLAESQKMEAVGRLAAGVAHEFNNYLSVLVSSLEYMGEVVEESNLASRDIIECLDDAMSAASQAKLVARQLLTFSRPAEGSMERVDISLLMREVVQLCRRTFERTVGVVLDCPPGLCCAGDRGLLGQAFMNLCINARDAMPGGGRLTITVAFEVDANPTRALPGTVVIRASDTGMGMEETTVAHVFEPFLDEGARAGDWPRIIDGLRGNQEPRWQDHGAEQTRRRHDL